MRAWWNLIRNGRKTFIHTFINYYIFKIYHFQLARAWLVLGVIKNIQVYVRGKASSSLSLLNITISTFAKLYATFAVNRYLITSLWWVASQHRWHVRCWWEIGPLGADTGPGPARYRSPLLRVSVATLRGSGYNITPPLATHFYSSFVLVSSDWHSFVHVKTACWSHMSNIFCTVSGQVSPVKISGSFCAIMYEPIIKVLTFWTKLCAPFTRPTVTLTTELFIFRV